MKRLLGTDDLDTSLHPTRAMRLENNAKFVPATNKRLCGEEWNTDAGHE
jgi:hypothetical protein